MTLYVVAGKRNVVNKALLLYAIKHAPSLIIDPANKANPHAFYPDVMPEDLTQVHVIEVELLHKLRDCIQQLPAMRTYGLPIITTFGKLMHYQDPLENDHVLRHAWELLREEGMKRTVIVGVESGSVQERLGAHYGEAVGSVWVIP